MNKEIVDGIDLLISKAQSLIVALSDQQDAEQSARDVWENQDQDAEDFEDTPEPKVSDFDDDIAKLEECIDYLQNARNELSA